MEMTSSTDPLYEIDDAEARYELNQRLIATGAIIGSVALAGQHIFTEVHLHGWPTLVITITSLFGWAAFGLGIFRNHQLGKTQEGKAFLAQARTDERLSTMRSQAFTYGFATMLGTQVVLLLLWTVLGQADGGWLSIPVAASSTIAAGVAGAVLRYQFLTNQ